MTSASPCPWETRWAEGRTRWDLGGEHPLLSELLRRASAAATPLPSKAIVLVPGAGRAHDAAAFARRGHQVVANDLVARAIDEARKLYADVPELSFHVGDVLTGPASWHGAFDVVYDRAMLCALPPPTRIAYLQAMARYLRKGGLFFSLPFTEIAGLAPGEGPPFATSLPEILEMANDAFTLVVAEERGDGAVDDRIRREMLLILRRV